MATTLYLRSTTGNGIGSTYLDMLVAAGAGASTCVVNTAASGTQIQWTVTGGGAVRQWVSGRTPAGGFTLAGQMTFSIWAEESNMSANCGIRVRVFKRTAAGSETEISSGWAYGSPTEIGFAGPVEYVWNGTPASTAFAENDRILIKVYIINVGTMASGYTCTLTYNAAAAATGDSLFTTTETVAFKDEDRRGNLSWNELEIPPAARRGRMAWGELEAPPGARRGRLSWSEVELPASPRKGKLSWSEMETPNAPRRGRFSWSELEVPELVLSRRGLLGWTELEAPAAPRRGQFSWAETETPTVPRRARLSWTELSIPGVGAPENIAKNPIGDNGIDKYAPNYEKNIGGGLARGWMI